LIYREAVDLNMDISFDYKIDEKKTIIIEDILNHCYQIDENQVPKTYKLMRLDKIFDNYDAMVNQIDCIQSRLLHK
jgi:hypothetical protein